MTAVNLNPPQFHAWMSEAACAEYPGDMWFAEKGGKGNLDDARAICGGCEVKAQCLQTALDNHETIGMWGGKTARQLKSLRNGEHRRRRNTTECSNGHDRATYTRERQNGTRYCGECDLQRQRNRAERSSRGAA